MTPGSKYAVISFDLQGTLSDSAFSDEFWLSRLPELYAAHHKIPLQDAKTALKTQFKEIGKYHRLYYCGRTWVDQLCAGRSVASVASELSNRPHLWEETLALVRELHRGPVPLIILSTTTHDFIELELAHARQHFKEIFSTLDDFSMPGKSPEAFREAARRMGVETNQILHIGDCPEMDIRNGLEAGCQTFFFDKTRPRAQLIEELTQVLRAQ